MRISETTKLFMDYHRINSKKNTLRNYDKLISCFRDEFGERQSASITTEEIITFLNQFTEGRKQSTKKLRYSLLSAFFNFLKNSFEQNLQNPCDSPLLRKMYRDSKHHQWKILDKEIVDEMIFRTINLRNRIILELMARGGIRIGEVLKITPSDIEDSKVILREPKSGKETEDVFIPLKLAEKIKEYIRGKGIESNNRIFPITYPAARVVVKKAGNILNLDIKPHDLRRHAATYSSCAGTPIEIVSKLILRHANLSTTQRCLGKVSDVEAVRWIENLYG